MRASVMAAASAMTGAVNAGCRPPVPRTAVPILARNANVTAPPAHAPIANATHDAVVRRRGALIVSMIEKPHGDHVPVTPATNATRISVTVSTEFLCRST